MSSGDVSIGVTASTDGVQAGFDKAASAAEKQMARIQKAMAFATVQIKEMKKAQEASTGSSGFKQAADEAERATGITAGFTRELIVLGHEATQGNFSRMGGSMLVLAERSSVLTSVVHGLIGPMGLAAAAAAAFAFEVIKGAHEQDAFNKSLVLTGNYAGQTAASYHALAQSLAASTTATIGSAKEVVQELISTGVIGPRLMADFGQAVVRTAALTGQNSEEVVKDFAKMQEGVAKWAEEHNRSMHFLSATQYEYVRSLEEAGKTEEATKVVLDAYNGSLAEQDRNLGSLAKGWTSVKKGISEYIDYLNSLGKSTTVESQISSIQKSIKVLEESRQEALHNATLGPLTAGAYQGEAARYAAQIAQQQALLDHLQAGKQTADKLAAATADSQKVQAEGIAARKRLDDMLAQERGAQGLHKALEELQRDFDRAAKAGTPYSDAEKKTLTDNVTRKYTPRADLKLQNEFDATRKSLEDETVKVQAQTDAWKKYGKQLDDSKEAVIRFRTTQGDLKNLTDAQKSTLIGLARGEDSAKQAEIAAKETSAAKQRVEALEEEAKARQQSAREMAVEQKVRTALGQSEDAELEARAKSAAAAIYDKEKSDAFTRSLAEQSIGIDKEVKTLNEQADMIGKTTIERQKDADAIKLQAEAERLKAQNAGKAAEIDAWATEQIRKLTQARQQDYDVQRKFSTGAANAFAKYQEDATNSAKFAETFISGSMSRMEDALTKFVETGKLSFKDLFQFMADEFIRQQIRMQLAAATAPGGSLSGLASIFGAGSAGGAPYQGTVTAPPSVPDFGPFATAAVGTNYVPQDNMPFLLHKGEAVVPAAYNPAAGAHASGGDVNITQHISVGEGVSTSQLYAACVQAKDAAKTEILQSIKHRGVFAS